MKYTQQTTGTSVQVDSIRRGNAYADAELLRSRCSASSILKRSNKFRRQRLRVVDISHRVAYGPGFRESRTDTAIVYVPDGNVERPAVEISFRELQHQYRSDRSVLRARASVKPMSWQFFCRQSRGLLSILGAPLRLPFRQLDAGAKHCFACCERANVKAVIALGPKPGFSIGGVAQIFEGSSPQPAHLFPSAARKERDSVLRLQSCIEIS